MGMTQRNGGSGMVAVNVRPSVKTCPEEAGIFESTLEDGTKLFAMANMFFPSHDRGAIATIHKMLRDQRDLEASKPAGQRNRIVVILLGGILHEEAFKQIIDEEDEASKLLRQKPIAEITAIREEHELFEDRFLALARLGGEFISAFAESSGGTVLYVPSVFGSLPNEVDFMRFVLEKKKQLDRKADKHPEEAVKGPDIPEDLAEFLGLHKNPNVKVLPFGAALEINEDHRFTVGDFQLRVPGSAGDKEVSELAVNMNVTRAGNGTAASNWWTTPVHSFGGNKRTWRQAHELPCLFDVKLQLGYLRRYHLRGTGLWAGKIVGGKVNGAVIPLPQGTDGCRAMLVFGRIYSEDAPSARAHRVKLDLNDQGGRVTKLPAPKPTSNSGARKASAKKPASKKVASTTGKTAARRTGGTRGQK